MTSPAFDPAYLQAWIAALTPRPAAPPMDPLAMWQQMMWLTLPPMQQPFFALPVSAAPAPSSSVQTSHAAPPPLLHAAPPPRDAQDDEDEDEGRPHSRTGRRYRSRSPERRPERRRGNVVKMDSRCFFDFLRNAYNECSHWNGDAGSCHYRHACRHAESHVPGVATTLFRLSTCCAWWDGQCCSRKSTCPYAASHTRDRVSPMYEWRVRYLTTKWRPLTSHRLMDAMEEFYIHNIVHVRYRFGADCLRALEHARRHDALDAIQRAQRMHPRPADYSAAICAALPRD